MMQILCSKCSRHDQVSTPPTLTRELEFEKRVGHGRRPRTPGKVLRSSYAARNRDALDFIRTARNEGLKGFVIRFFMDEHEDGNDFDLQPR